MPKKYTRIGLVQVTFLLKHLKTWSETQKKTFSSSRNSKTKRSNKKSALTQK